MKCPCGKGASFQDCCHPLITGTRKPKTAEQLMRSRYSAYTLAEIDYIKKTLAPEMHDAFNVLEAKAWALSVKWKGLKIHRTEKGLENDQVGVVEFSAYYEINGDRLELHEVSRFRKNELGRWLYVDGDIKTS